MNQSTIRLVVGDMELDISGPAQKIATIKDILLEVHSTKVISGMYSLDKEQYLALYEKIKDLI